MRRYAKRIYIPALIICLLINALIGSSVYAQSQVWTYFTIRINQIVVGNDSSSTFSYLLTPTTPNTPMPYGSTSEGFVFSATGAGEAHIESIEFDGPGIYVYELRCIAGESSVYNIDRQVYTIEVHVINNSAISSVVLISNDIKLPYISFEHRHIEAPADPIIAMSPEVFKIIEGEPLAANVFSFELVAENPGNPMPDDSIGNLKRISIIGSGQGSFGSWTYDSEGIYRYMVSEINTGLDNYEFDTNVYIITDEVGMVDGRLTVFRTITDKLGQPAASLTFVNMYISDSPFISTEGPDENGILETSPQTGDFSNPFLWISVITIGSLLLILTGFIGYKTRGRGD